MKVSVVIPCYKQAHFLSEAIQSCLDQNYTDKEIIVVNDGSADNTSEVVAAFGNKIVYIEQENKGLSAARNTGIKAAQGEYIALLDSDDVCLPGRLTTQVAYLETHPDVGLIVSDAVHYDGEKLLELRSKTAGKPHKTDDFRWETVNYCPTPSTFMVRRECFKVIGFFDERMTRAGEDWLFAVQVSLKFKLAFINVPTILYRIHTANATRKLELINQQNRIACSAAINWSRFNEYPAHFRAKLLFYRFATAWRSEPPKTALYYLGKAIVTDPTQIGYGMKVIYRGLRNTFKRLGAK